MLCPFLSKVLLERWVAVEEGRVFLDFFSAPWGEGIWSLEGGEGDACGIFGSPKKVGSTL